MTEPVTREKLFQLMGIGPVWELREGSALDAPSAQQPAESVLAFQNLEDLRQAVANCQKCSLSQTRTQTVFSAGVPGSPVMVVGEAPGADEDAQGEPFVGRAGQLLERMLEAAGLSRQTNVYIGNVLKCRPPGNRDPQREEIEECLGFLRAQIELNKPKVLFLVGKFAIKTLLETEETVGKLRGKVYEVSTGAGCIPAVVSYHPAYLLRQPIEKRKSWDDLLLLKNTLAGL